MKLGVRRRSILLASIGTSPGVLTNTVWGVPAPEWTEDDADDFRVILKRPMSAPSAEKTMVNTGVESRVESRVKRPAKKLSSAEKIVAYLVSNPTASAHELSIAVNLTVKGIEKNLKALRESGRLRHVGPPKGGHWEVVG